ncbi:ABC transporter substrate-binding protein [Nocardia bovistercoris]|uniref:ABC transporter substrate-binding protein n=1 Tax=Nocardia bovistercoris TaxID=2785916 RepID=A0A931MZM6_9NOCA|nr:ABC transporter substrate-binding protein [Nocardia bovistercoris]MBH0776315.1 ABC transporter substrate-binding protein [Nocardia bovistercoris]
MKIIRPLIAVLAVASLVSGCGRDGTGQREDEAGSDPATSVSKEFGDLGAVCGDGSPTKAAAQGVTAETVTVGVFTDFGFSKNSEFIDAAQVFTSWCNDHGGIAGRRIEISILDTKLTEVRQRMREACRDDFVLVGGGTGLDALGVKDRLSCLLPSFPAQVSQPGSVAADLEISASPSSLPRHDVYTGFRQWLVKEGYPQSIDKVGIIDADSPITKTLGDKTEESLRAQGATVVYHDLYPIAGVASWAPYAQTIKEKQVRGLVFNGEPAQLPKLEEALTEIGYSPDWIDATNNNYTPAFLKALGRSLEFQNNVVDLSGVAPFEKTSTVPALRQVEAMFARYAPDAKATFPQLRAISSWLLFVEAATRCGDDLTRRCVYDAASSMKSWTGGGLHAPVNLTDREVPIRCFNVERATPAGWVPADFRPDAGLYRCDVERYRFTGNYGGPMTLADVGKSMADLN